MHFLSQGDYNFPFSWPLYWAKHVYMWSYQSGTPNPDGFIRLPGRVFNFLIFALFGNLAVSYFYVLSSLLVAGLAFYFFSRNFLKVRSQIVRIIGALFFALNPLFLGNLAKVGLVLAAAMLPLCFVLLQRAFETKQLRYLILWIICLNISLMHPYTFMVNLAASGLYFCWLSWQNREFVVRNLHKFALVGVLALLLNAYFILPVFSLGTVSKDVISDSVVPTQTDYTSLVSFSNTGDIFTGLALTKNVFLDFNFYSERYQPLYLLGTFGFYALMIAAYLSTEKYLFTRDKRYLAVMLGSFLLLVVLATTMVFGVNQIIKILITLPGGWAFRSPLKWQLYIPLALFGMLVLLLNNMGDDRRRHFIEVGLVASFILMNGYLFYDVYKMLLVPRTLTNFTQLANADLDGKSLLYVNSPDCMQFNQDHPRLVTEMNQVFVSRNLQVKRVLIDDLATVNVGSYDYVMGCVDNLQNVLEHEYQFTLADSFVQGAYHLYANHAVSPQVYALDNVYALHSTADIGAAYQFAGHAASEPFAFIRSDGNTDTMSGLLDIFGNVSASNMHSGVIAASVPVGQGGQYVLHARPDTHELYYKLTAPAQLALAAHNLPGYQPLSPQTPVTLALSSSQPLQVAYENHTFSYQNLVKDPSFESGLWQKSVGDCYAFDNQPQISMQLDRSQKTDGTQSLELSATHHIACTGPEAINATPGAHYLLGFDYTSTGDNNAGLHVAFDDPAGTTITHRLQSKSNDWQHYSEEIAVPTGAHRIHILLYAYPGQNERAAITHYDRISLVQIPPLQNILYLTGAATTPLKIPTSIAYQIINPTKKTIHISGASQPFYLASTDSYHPLWQLAFTHSGAAMPWSLSRQQLATTEHIRLNNTMNAWYIDPSKLCADSACKREADGSYDIDLTMQFASQHWFYVGATISGLAWAGTVSYFAYAVWHGRRKIRKYQLWR